MLIAAMLHLRQLRKNQWLEPERLREIQQEKLKRIVQHAYENVRYYRKLFDSAGVRPEDIDGPADLTKIPITARSELQRQSLDQIVATGVDLERCRKLTTAGSSGAPLTVFLSQMDSRFYDMGWARASLENGRRLWDRAASFRSYRTPRFWFQGLGIWRKETISILEDLTTKIARLRRIRPDIIQATTFELVMLAKFIMANRITGISPRLVLSRGTLLDPRSRETIRSAFGAPVVDCYGATELGCIAWECSERRGHHINVDALVLEVVREGAAAAPGEAGKLVCTGLHSFAMPFIRYELGDIGALATEPCPCGRGLPLLKDLHGRADDFFVSSKGELISPQVITSQLKSIPGISQFRIVQESEHKINAEIVADTFCSSSAATALVQTMRRIMGEEVNVKVELKDVISADRSGKIRSLVSKVRASLYA